MNRILQILLMDEFTAIHLFSLIKLGVIHPKGAPGRVKGIMFGLWRFEIQFILGFWDKNKRKELIYNA